MTPNCLPPQGIAVVARYSADTLSTAVAEQHSGRCQTKLGSSGAESTKLGSSGVESTKLGSSGAESTKLGSSGVESTKLGSSGAESTKLGSSGAESTKLGSSGAESVDAAAALAVPATTRTKVTNLIVLPARKLHYTKLDDRAFHSESARMTSEDHLGYL